MSPPPEPVVVVPAGRPILDAARWVGNACWAEVRLYEVLTAWLAVEADDAVVARMWTVRSAAAQRAAVWHGHLPELREFPRSTFVRPSSDAVAEAFDQAAALIDPAGTAARQEALVALIDGLRAGYEQHRSVAVGPADGPVAASLRAVRFP